MDTWFLMEELAYPFPEPGREPLVQRSALPPAHYTLALFQSLHMQAHAALALQL